MAAFIFSGTSLKSPAFIQWNPTLTSHDPSPPIALEGNPNTIAPGSIATQESFGTPTVNANQTITVTSIPSEEAFGTSVIIQNQLLLIFGIDGQEQFGVASFILVVPPVPPVPPTPPREESACFLFGVGPCVGTPGVAAAGVTKGRSGRQGVGRSIGYSGRSDSLHPIDTQ